MTPLGLILHRAFAERQISEPCLTREKFAARIGVSATTFRRISEGPHAGLSKATLRTLLDHFAKDKNTQTELLAAYLREEKRGLPAEESISIEVSSSCLREQTGIYISCDSSTAEALRCISTKASKSPKLRAWLQVTAELF